MNDFNDVMRELENGKQDTKARIEAWEKFRLVYKKDGLHFSVFSKNFEGASIGKYSIIEDSMHPYLTICYNVNGRYETEHIEIYFYLDKLPETDERRKEYIPQFMRQTVTMSFDEISATVRNHIENLKKQFNDYCRQIEIAKNVYNEYVEKVTKAKKELFEQCGDKNTLYYEVLHCFNT